MTKRDLTKERKTYFSAGRKPSILQLPEVRSFVMTDGSGDPSDSPSFQEKTRLLHNLVGRIRSSESPGVGEFEMPPLEALWWTEHPEDFSLENRDLWQWRLMVMIPDELARDDFERARARVSYGRSDSALDSLRLGTRRAGRVAQILHVGPYPEEKRSLKILETFLEGRGYRARGVLHEIYLGNPRRVAPERLRTILRLPLDDD